MPRHDGRAPDQIRPVRVVPHYLEYAEGSALIELGRTRVICAASVEDRVAPFAREKRIGWITAEYSLLPRSTLTRTPRESVIGRLGGRTHEIQRLIGRSLRAAVELHRLGDRTITVDCDVLQADGGTRTAAITGGYVALVFALRRLVATGALAELPVRWPVAAISAGVVDGEAWLDLDYEEDSRAHVDFNVVMAGDGRFVEIQGTAEGEPFSQPELQRLLDLSAKGVRELLHEQLRVLAGT